MFFEQVFYDWLVIAGVFIVIELLTFTYLFLWLTCAALLVAGLTFLMPQLSLTLQFSAFAVLSVLVVAVWLKLHKKSQDASGDNRMNNRAFRYVGRTVTIHEAIVNGDGKVRIDDSYWRVRGEDMPAGTKAKVVGCDGVILNVEAVD